MDVDTDNEPQADPDFDDGDADFADETNNDNDNDNDNNDNENDGFGDDDENAGFEDDDGEWDDDGDDGDWGDGAEIDAATGMVSNKIDITKEPNSNNNIENKDNDIVMGSSRSGVSGVQQQIPKLTRDALTSNCMEINMIPMFVAKADLKSRSRIGAMIGIRIDQLTNITIEQLEVWGITPKYKFLAFRFEFGAFYLNEGESPSLHVGLSEKLRWEEPLKQFRLSWTIGERIKNSLLSNEHWDPGSIDLNKIPDCGKINELMESTQQEYGICLEALLAQKFDFSNALNMMLDENEIKRLNKKLASNEKSQIQFENILNKVWNPNNEKHQWEDFKQDYRDEYENVADSSKIKQLMDMFGISQPVAKFAFNTHGYDEAVVKLMNPTEKDSIIAMATSIEETKQQKRDSTGNIDKVSDFFQNYSDSNNNNNNNNNGNNSNKKSGFGVVNKVKNLFGSNKDKDNNDYDLNDLDEKMSDLTRGLSETMDIKRTQSQGLIQQCGKKDLQRSMTRMLEHNWLLRVLCFGLKVLLNGNKFCLICDKPLEFAGLKPSICDKPFCQFRHDEMELGFNLADELVLRPEVIDLLISMMHAACKTNRYQDFFPHGVRADTINIDTKSPTSTEEIRIDPLADPPAIPDTSITDPFEIKMDSFLTNEVADPQKVLTVIDACPEVSVLQEWARKGKKYLKQECFNTHPLLYHFLSWIITSNRSHLKLLSEAERIKDIDTPYQFAMCASTPQREAAFQRLQHRNGSFLAWHGSGFGNWHSILRMGLKNYSGTKHQLNGAAYGSGVYLGKTFSLSWSYCRNGSGMGWSKSQYGTAVNCMSLCEVCYHDDDADSHRLDSKSASAVDLNSLNNNNNNSSNSSLSNMNKKKKDTSSRYDNYNREKDPKNRWVKTNGIYVVNSEEHICTRFFFIFANASYNFNAKVQNANDVTIPKVVKSFD